jgi:hypothetical protein
MRLHRPGQLAGESGEGGRALQDHQHAAKPTKTPEADAATSTYRDVTASRATPTTSQSANPPAHRRSSTHAAGPAYAQLRTSRHTSLHVRCVVGSHLQHLCAAMNKPTVCCMVNSLRGERNRRDWLVSKRQTIKKIGPESIHDKPPGLRCRYITAEAWSS